MATELSATAAALADPIKRKHDQPHDQPTVLTQGSHPPPKPAFPGPMGAAPLMLSAAAKVSNPAAAKDNTAKVSDEDVLILTQQAAELEQFIKYKKVFLEDDYVLFEKILKEIHAVELSAKANTFVFSAKVSSGQGYAAVRAHNVLSDLINYYESIKNGSDNPQLGNDENNREDNKNARESINALRAINNGIKVGILDQLIDCLNNISSRTKNEKDLKEKETLLSPSKIIDLILRLFDSYFESRKKLAKLLLVKNILTAGHSKQEINTALNAPDNIELSKKDIEDISKELTKSIEAGKKVLVFHVKISQNFENFFEANDRPDIQTHVTFIEEQISNVNLNIKSRNNFSNSIAQLIQKKLSPPPARCCVML